MKKAVNRIAALLALIVLCCVPAMASAEFSYESVDAAVPVGGTGTFRIKEAGAGDDEAFDSIEIEDAGSFSLSFAEPDDYAYEVFSTDAENPARYDVLVRVLVGADDVLQPNVVVTEKDTGRKTPSAFYPICVEPLVEKQIKGEPEQEDEFSFVFKGIAVTAEDLDDVPMPEDAGEDGKTLTIKGKGTASAGTIRLDRAGTYEYEWTEIAGKAKNCSYDTAVFRLTYTVTETETGLQAATTLTRNGAPSELEHVTFVNEYTKPNVPQTGDGSRPGLWLAVMSGSLVLCAVLVRARKRQAA